MTQTIRREHLHDNGWISSARYSPCETFRYTLQRVWDTQRPIVSFIGLNPSTATEIDNDPTVRRCIGFAHSWGFGGMRMLNAFALRSTDPKKLKQVKDPVGPENDAWLKKMTADVPLTVACWGVHAGLNDRHLRIIETLEKSKTQIHCLGVTKAGFPKHPLYLKQTLTAIPFLSTEGTLP